MNDVNIELREPVAKVRRYCDRRIPERARDQVRLDVEVDALVITIVEWRAPWQAELGPEWARSPIAQLRCNAQTQEWTLYWRDRNLRFRRYDRIASSLAVDDLLDEIERDPTGVFWG